MSIRVAVAMVVVGCLCASVVPELAGATVLPPGFQQTTAIRGLTSPDGRRVRAQRPRLRGREERDRQDLRQPLGHDRRRSSPTCARRSTTSPRRGLLVARGRPGLPGQALHLRLLHARRADRRHAARCTGRRRRRYDNCAGDRRLDENCIASVRVSRLRVAGEVMTGPEQVLVEDYCQQFRSTRAEDSSSAPTATCTCPAATARPLRLWDYGQLGTPANPCGDPPGRGRARC